MTLLLIFFVTSLVGAISYYLWIWTYWRRRGVKGPMGLPLIGSLIEMTDHETSPHFHVREWTKKYGKAYGITEGTHRTLVISDPELVNEVFIKQFDNFYGRKLNAVQGNPDKDKRINLFISQGHRWKRLRAISSPTFSNNSLRKIKDTVENSVFELLRHMEKETSNGESIDMLKFFQEFTLDVIGRIAMGQHESQMFNNPMLNDIKPVFSEGRSFLFRFGALFPFAAPLVRKMMFSISFITKNPIVNVIKFSTEAVENRIKQRESDAKKGIEPQEPCDYIDFFLDACSDDSHSAENSSEFSKTTTKVNRQLTVDEVVAQCFVFLLAGFDTTSLSLSYSSFLLATHPDKMKKLQEEVDRECPDPSISFDQISKLKYMDCVVKETLRMYPLATLANSRRCMKSTKIGDYEVEKGTDILVDTWTLHYDKTIWGEDADEFRPERWENGDDSGHKVEFLPFGLGPRQCVGMRLAYMEERLLLAHILKKYTFVTGKSTQIPLKLYGRLTTQPKSVDLHLKPRY